MLSSRSLLKGLAVTSAAIVFTVAGGVSALAEETVIDGDAALPITATGPINLGTACLGSTATTSRLVAAKRTLENPTVSWRNNADLTASASTTGAGASVTVPDASIGLGFWANANYGTLSNDTAQVTLSVVAASSPTTMTGTLVVALSGSQTGSNTPLTRSATVAWTLKAVSCNTAPTISVNDVSLQGNTLGGRTLAFGDIGTAGDAEDSGTPTVTCDPAIGSLLPLGATTVTCTAKDSGNLTTSDSGVVTVVDTTEPVISGTPGSASLEASSSAGAVHTYSAPTASDVVWGTLAVNCVPASGSTFELGTTTVTCTATDGSKNTAKSTFQVNVHDETAPKFTQPEDVTQEATSGNGAVVDFATPSAEDAVSGAISGDCDPGSGTQFPLGDTTVTCTATDGAGNKGSTSFVVHVVDTTAPDLVVPGTITEEATSPAGASVAYNASATDAVDADPTVICTPASGSTFELGQTEVTCTATDDEGNASHKSFTVKVQDTTPPVLQGMPEDMTVEGNTTGGALEAFTAPTATDVVDPNPTVECVPAESAFFKLGETEVTCTATDATGNKSTGSFTVTVTDTTAPTLSNVPSDAVVEGNTAGGANWSFTSPTATDTVDASPTVECTPASGSFFALGKTTVTCTASDASNNTSPAAGFVVTVEDTTPPGIQWTSTAPAANPNDWNNEDVTVTWTCSDVVGLQASTVSAVVSTEGAGQAATGTCTDTSGNTASDDQRGINIDLTKPVVGLVGGPADGGEYYFGSVPAAPTCSAADALSGIDGACSVSGYGTQVGAHTVTATATDKAGNTATTSRTYTVLGWTPKGFYSPVDLNGVWNSVKGGSTVPLKFEVFAGAELTATSTVKSFVQTRVNCDTNATVDEIEVTSTGGTSLRYDSTAGQFVQNWQTPKLPGACYKVTVTTQDGSFLTANFKLK